MFSEKHVISIYCSHLDCKTGVFSLCDITNDSKVMETLYGHRICGAFGYSHLTGSSTKLVTEDLTTISSICRRL